MINGRMDVPGIYVITNSDRASSTSPTAQQSHLGPVSNFGPNPASQGDGGDSINPDQQVRDFASPSRFSVGSFHQSVISIFSSLEGPRLNLQIASLSDTKPVEFSSTTASTVESQVIPIQKCQWVRNICLLGMAAGLVLSLVAIGWGGYLLHGGLKPPPPFLANTAATIGSQTYVWYGPEQLYRRGHVACIVPQGTTLILPLVLNYVVTAVFAAMGYIHSTTLRWALWRESTLRYNSNVRLFQRSKSHIPNSWYINVLSICSLVFAYGSLTALTSTISILGFSGDPTSLSDIPYTGPTNGIDVSGCAMCVLGVCVLVQFIISASCLLHQPAMVKTWSSSPIINAKARAMNPVPDAMVERIGQPSNSSRFSSRRPTLLEMVETKTKTLTSTLSWRDSPKRTNTITTLSSFESSISVHAPTHQPSARVSVASVRWITRTIWLLLIIAVVGTIIATAFAIRTHTTQTTFIQSTGAGLNSIGYWHWFGKTWFIYADPTAQGVRDPREMLGITIQSLFQSVLTLSIHYTELLTKIVADERKWREAYSQKGARTDSTFSDHIKDWPALILFVFTGLVQWVFGEALSVDYFVMIGLLPTITLTIMLLLLAISAEALARHKPKGPQPATYGDLKLLAELMDEMEHETIYWGDKGEKNGVRITGTSGTPLPEVRSSRLYFGKLV